MLLVDIYILFFDGSYEQGYWFFAFMIIIDFFYDGWYFINCWDICWFFSIYINNIIGFLIIIIIGDLDSLILKYLIIKDSLSVYIYDVYLNLKTFIWIFSFWKNGFLIFIYYFLFDRFSWNLLH